MTRRRRKVETDAPGKPEPETDTRALVGDLKAAQPHLERVRAAGGVVDYRITPAGLDIEERWADGVDRGPVTIFPGMPNPPPGVKVWPVKLWVTDEAVQFLIDVPDRDHPGFFFRRTKTKEEGEWFDTGIKDEYLFYLLNDTIITACEVYKDHTEIYIRDKSDYDPVIVGNRTARLKAVAADSELTVAELQQAIDNIKAVKAGLTAREPTGDAEAETRAASETPPVTQTATVALPQPRHETATAPVRPEPHVVTAEALFGDVPASLQRRRPYTKRNWSEAALANKAAISKANEIVGNYNYRKGKGEQFSDAEYGAYRSAKSLLSAVERRQKAAKAARTALGKATL